MPIAFTPERLTRIRASRHWADGQFINPVETNMMLKGETWNVFAAWLAKGRKGHPARSIPVIQREAASFSAVPEHDVRVTWMGHSSVMVEVDGARVLTDPVWSERASPVQFAGPRRFHPPPVLLRDLPTPDVVLISHDHYDHLDRTSLEALKERTSFVVPLGVGQHLEQWGVAPARITELDWWQTHPMESVGLTVVSTPARHFSGRGVARNNTQWASYAIIGKHHRVYFGGDSGLHPGFEEIGKRLGPFDLSLLEIGAYHPSWGDIHLGPDNALAAHRMLGARVLMPIHWATFDLGLHAWNEPPDRLHQLATEQGLEVMFPRVGESVPLSGLLPRTPWWK